nr:unnamed protein product [Callosobruchus analis]
MNQGAQKSRENHVSESQAFSICEGQNKEFYDSLRLRNEVLNKMRVYEISKVCIEDTLICSYGEIGIKSLFEAFKPELFDNILTATKITSGYNKEPRTSKPLIWRSI